MCGINLFFFGEFTTIKIERAKKEKPSGIGPFCEQKKISVYTHPLCLPVPEPSMVNGILPCRNSYAERRYLLLKRFQFQGRFLFFHHWIEKEAFTSKLTPIFQGSSRAKGAEKKMNPSTTITTTISTTKKIT